LAISDSMFLATTFPYSQRGHFQTDFQLYRGYTRVAFI